MKYTFVSNIFHILSIDLTIISLDGEIVVLSSLEIEYFLLRFYMNISVSFIHSTFNVILRIIIYGWHGLSELW